MSHRFFFLGNVMSGSSPSCPPRQAPSICGEEALANRNQTMQQLTSIFPHVMPIVFREMIATNTADSSPLLAVADQLLHDPDRWVQGRWKVNLQQTGFVQDIRQQERIKLAVSPNEQFRREGYKKAVRQALSQEFRSLHKSTIDAVTAETNYSYTRARPVLQGIEAKSWRRVFRNIFRRRQRRSAEAEETLDDHYMLVWSGPPNRNGNTTLVPMLRATSDPELKQELEEKILGPILEREKTKQEEMDSSLALLMNESEARDAGALYECECCFHEATFERIAFCDMSGHISCFSCLCRAFTEALYGQGWGRNIDHERGLVRCLAPSSHQACTGCIPFDVAQRAIVHDLGMKQWLQFELSMAKEALIKSRLPLIHCPFCSYAEIDERSDTLELSQYRLITTHLTKSIFLGLLALFLLPLLQGIILLQRVFAQDPHPHITTMIFISLRSLYSSKYPTRRFLCRSPTCALPSCISCRKIWCDPHMCYESTALSLRTTIESARTAALKRTCPYCGLSFIKESGCNKLTCRCGHTMCYLCRQSLGRFSGGEAYVHFCQHFRPAGGRCEACDKCDLYQADDEETLVNKAGEKAEKEWRKRGGMDAMEGMVYDDLEPRQWVEQWAVQGWINWLVRKLIIC